MDKMEEIPVVGFNEKRILLTSKILAHIMQYENSLFKKSHVDNWFMLV